MSAFDLRALLLTLTGEDVEFVVIGAVAVAAHGHIRATRDLDLVPSSAPDNFERLVLAISRLQATLPLAGGRRFDPARDASVIRRGANLTLDSEQGGVDIVQRAPGVPSFAELDTEAIDTDLLGIPVRVCSLRHLRQMKEAAGRLQDRADLEHLPQE